LITFSLSNANLISSTVQEVLHADWHEAWHSLQPPSLSPPLVEPHTYRSIMCFSSLWRRHSYHFPLITGNWFHKGQITSACRRHSLIGLTHDYYEATPLDINLAFPFSEQRNADISANLTALIARDPSKHVNRHKTGYSIALLIIAQKSGCKLLTPDFYSFKKWKKPVGVEEYGPSLSVCGHI